MNNTEQILEDQKKTLKYQKIDIINIAIFTLFFLLLCILTWGKMGDPFPDCGREAYVPLEILRGKVFIKDIYVFFNACPLSFQINAFLYKIFGVSLSVLYLAGITCSYIIMMLVYFITRTLFKPLTAFSAVICVMGFAIFIPYVFDYIFPYSYATLYATLGLVLAVYLGVNAIQNNENKKFNLFLNLAFLALGFSIANKLDYISVISIFLLLPLIKKRISVKCFISCFICLIIPLTLSFIQLFIIKLNFQDLLFYLKLGKNYLASPASRSMYGGMFYFSYIDYITLIIKEGIIFLVLFWMINNILNYLNKKTKLFSSLFLTIFIFTSAFMLMQARVNDALGSSEFFYLFSWFSPLAMFSLIYIFYKYKGNLRDNVELLSSIFIVGCAVCSTFKTFFMLFLEIYGSFMFPLAMISILIIFVKFIPIINTKFKDKDAWEKNVALTFIVIGLIAVFLNVFYQLSYKSKIITSKGIFYATDPKNLVVNQALDYIDNNVPKDSTVLVFPEGAMINFLSGRKSNDKYYQLIPNHIESIGEENIVKDLNKYPPEFVFIDNFPTPQYGKNFFCEDYGKKICSFVIKNYNEEKIIKYNYYSMPNKALAVTEMKIYKHK